MLRFIRFIQLWLPATISTSGPAPWLIFVGLLEDQDNLVDKVLCEAKSPSVMRHVGDTLLQEGVELFWNPRDSSVIRNVLNKVNVVFPVACNVLTRFMEAAKHLGVRKLEWLFLISHNHWIVCRLVRHDGHHFLQESVSKARQSFPEHS